MGSVCVLFVGWHTEVDPDGDELLHLRLGDMEGMVMDGGGWRKMAGGRRKKNYEKKVEKASMPKKI